MDGCFTRNAKGFTLIELLIVVGMIGLLAAIAVVNLIPAHQRARYAKAAGDTKEIVTQAMVITSDYNLTPNAGLGFPLDPTFLWTQPTPAGLPQLQVYMTSVWDPWAPATTDYQFAENPGVGPGCGGAPVPGCVIFSAWTIGGNGNPEWDGLAASAAMGDDLGNSTVQGCVSGPNVGIANPC